MSEALVASKTQNGSFLADIEARAANASPLAEATATVSNHYIQEGGLGFALEHMQSQSINVVSDYWHNSALDALADSPEASEFNDSTSNAAPRTREQYLGRVSLRQGVEENPLNTDDRFPGQRPLGFEIGKTEQPVMAIAALDPALLPEIDEQGRTELIEEVKALRLEATSSDEAVRTAATEKMSPHLREVLSTCLLANNTVIDSHEKKGQVEAWKLPYDLIASLKALYTLLSGEETSASMRQGAVRVTSPEGQTIIVGCSGLNSAIDEMVARNFATDVLAQQTQTPQKP